MTNPTLTETPVQPIASTVPELVIWNELNTRDGGAAAKFYTQLFNWGTAQFAHDGNLCTLMTIGPRPIAGIVQNPSPEMRSLWLPYVQVASVDETLARSVALGARVVMPAVDVPKVGRIAVFQDPQGAAMGIVQNPQGQSLDSRGNLVETDSGASVNP